MCFHTGTPGTPVRAAREIWRGGTVVARAPKKPSGRIVNLTQNWSGTTYTVEFVPEPGATVTVIGLTEGDIRPS